MQYKEKNKKYIHYQIFIAMVLLFLLFCGGIGILTGEKQFSEMENRYLTSFSVPHLAEILDGKAQEQLEQALEDQFPWRDACVQISVSLKRLLGAKDAGGVYFGKDGHLIEKKLSSQLPYERYARNRKFITAAMEELHQQGDEAGWTLVLVPFPGSIDADLLPAGAREFDEAGYREQAAGAEEPDQKQAAAAGAEKELDLYAQFREKREAGKRLYFATDHHYNASGAWEAAQALREMFHLPEKKQEDFGMEQVTDAFYGTLYSKAPLPEIRPDSISIPTKLPELSVEIDGKPVDAGAEPDGGAAGAAAEAGEAAEPGGKAAGAEAEAGGHRLWQIYDMEKLRTKDKYAVYFGGNYGKVVIRKKASAKPSARRSGMHSGKARRICVIKDSYANSCVPYLFDTESFPDEVAELTMIDLRYFNDSFQELAAQEQYDEILVFYEMSNFIEADYFNKLLG